MLPASFCERAQRLKPGAPSGRKTGGADAAPAIIPAAPRIYPVLPTPSPRRSLRIACRSDAPTINPHSRPTMTYSKIPAGKDLPNDMNVVIEIPANSDPIKYEIDKDADALFVDRFVATTMFYPVNYGYVPGTLSEDGDALDALVVTPYAVVPGAVIRSRPVGVLKMTDDGGPDAKLIAVPHSKLTTLYNHVKEVEDLPELLKRQIEHYFANYKALEAGKWVKIEGWGNADEARAEIIAARARYLAEEAK